MVMTWNASRGAVADSDAARGVDEDAAADTHKEI
jgi:hypothetical protein